MKRATTETEAIALAAQGEQALFVITIGWGKMTGLLFDQNAPRLHQTCSLIRKYRPVIVGLFTETQHVKLKNPMHVERVILLIEGKFQRRKKRLRPGGRKGPGVFDISCLQDPEIAG